MIGYQQQQSSLTKEQKEAVGLLSVGTFLEYFGVYQKDCVSMISELVHL